MASLTKQGHMLPMWRLTHDSKLNDSPATVNSGDSVTLSAVMKMIFSSCRIHCSIYWSLKYSPLAWTDLKYAITYKAKFSHVLRLPPSFLIHPHFLQWLSLRSSCAGIDWKGSGTSCCESEQDRLLPSSTRPGLLQGGSVEPRRRGELAAIQCSWFLTVMTSS